MSATPGPVADLAAALAALRAGEVAVIPTDTVYGVAVAASVPGATAKLFAVKRRPTDVALPVLVADLGQARSLAAEPFPLLAERLAERFWPGGLTLVVPRRPGLGLDLGGDDATVGLRQPAHPVPVALGQEVGPLVTTSANLHGRPTPLTAAEVSAELGPSVVVVVDGGRCEGAPSTVVDCTGPTPRLLREGRVPWAELCSPA